MFFINKNKAVIKAKLALIFGWFIPYVVFARFKRMKPAKRIAVYAGIFLGGIVIGVGVIAACFYFSLGKLNPEPEKTVIIKPSTTAVTTTTEAVSEMTTIKKAVSTTKPKKIILPKTDDISGDFAYATQDELTLIRSNSAAIDKNVSNKSNIYSNSSVKNILLVGYDNGNTNNYGRSDSVLILSLNSYNNTVKLVSLSRAVYTAIPGVGKMRLNMAFAYGGGKLLKETVTLNYKVKIDNYAALNFDTFSRVIDIIGGVNINLTSSEYNFLKPKLIKNKITCKGPGVYHLNGKLALEYVRLRSIDTDRDRTGRQRKLLLSAVSKMKKLNFSQASKLINRASEFVETDMSRGQIATMLLKFNQYSDWPLTTAIVPNKKYPLYNVNGTEYLFIDWNSNILYLKKLLYPQNY